MSLSLDSLLGVHQPALLLRSRRMEMLASNLANADTPNYKARDIDFRAALAQAKAGQASARSMVTTHANHIQPGGNPFLGGEPMYRNPMTPSIDGNTVDSQIEKAAFMENAIGYQASLHFLTSKFKGIKNAIKGGQQ